MAATVANCQLEVLSVRHVGGVPARSATLPREETVLTAASLAASVCAGVKSGVSTVMKTLGGCGKKGKDGLTLGCIAFCMFLTAGVGGVVCDE